MDAVRESINRPIVAGIVGAVLGAIFGLVVLGWGLFPVQWTDAAPEHLRADLREDYLRMVIESYGVNRDESLARQRYESLGDAAPEALARVAAQPEGLDLSAISQFSAVVGAEAPVGRATPAPVGASSIRNALLIMCGLTAVLAVVLALVFFVRRQQMGETGGAPTPQMEAQEASRQAERTDFEALGEEPPLAQFMTTYMLGDDLFDDSFSIDSPAGEFLGECGVGIAETIGVGEPKRVSAFEVWLFDKNDIQTVTKVLMSAHAYHDEATRNRLAAKGEPILAQPGNQVVLETATLQLVARVVDMSYGEGALPAESFFERVTLELAVWPKS